MNGRSKDEHHRSLSAHMIGKNDKAGRLIPDAIKFADIPYHPYWYGESWEAEHTLVRLLGMEAFNSWMDVSPESPDIYANWKECAEAYQAKVAQIKYCKHEWEAGGEEESRCKNCGALNGVQDMVI